LNNLNTDKQLESKLLEMWQIAEKSMKDELRKIELEMEIFLDELVEEKVNGTLQINNRYDIELNSMEVIVDLSK